MSYKVFKQDGGFFTLENVSLTGSVCPFVALCRADGTIYHAYAKTLRGLRVPTKGQLNELRGIALAYYLTETDAGRAEYAAAVAAIAA